ncbi:MAG: YjjG family noncanonical pyrimidine nucleotidase [Clostridia bacterium]|nr:YjjG family noncanonical pyrimidine nucleotidase [Clostridia bacterium]
MKHYTWLLFDADGTLLDFEKAERCALCEALAAHGVEATEEVITTYSAINDAIWKKIETGEFDRANLNRVRFSQLAERFGFTYDADQLGRDYFASMATQGHLIDGALALCQALKSRYSLAIITNGTASVQHGRLDGTPLLACMEGHFISQEVGAEKPSPAFFDAVEAAIPGFDRARALVIGDSLSSDIAGGIAAGIDTCWYNPAGKPAPADRTPTYTVANYDELRALLGV